LKGHIERLQQLNDKYNNQLIPVKVTFDYYIKTQQTIEHVLKLSEIKNVTGDLEKEHLRNEVVDLKTQQELRQRKFKVFLQFTFYILCLFIPVVLTIIFWNKHQNGKWFQLWLVLFPIISFLYDKDAFVGIFKYVLLKTEREKTKEEIKSKILRNYR
jgi:hypothetical protein